MGTHIVFPNQFKLVPESLVNVPSVCIIGLFLDWEVNPQLNLQVVCPVVISTLTNNHMCLDFLILLNKVQHRVVRVHITLKNCIKTFASLGRLQEGKKTSV